ncbi:MAG: hypothetical protein IMZ50_08795 [Candidatus Atribacteria bacterium]|nr:hypothetical protein [Candidatus Atribacteria bacterium]
MPTGTGTGTGDGITVIEDLLEGAALKHGQYGYEATRVFIVDGLSADPDARLYQALTHDDIPAQYEAHPSIPGLYCRERAANPAPSSPSKAVVTCVYRKPSYTSLPLASEGADIEVGCVLQPIETHVNYNGDLITVTYAGETREAPVQALRPQQTKIFTQIEDASPETKASTYVGKVNATGWDAASADAARTWLCTEITGRSSDGGATYTVRYVFVRRTEYPTQNWDEYVQFVDAQTGMPPSDLVAGTGRKPVQIYSEANFDTLALV